MLPKIHKRLHDVPGRPNISNCSYYTENISSFFDFQLQPPTEKVKSCIKDTNHFLSKVKSLGKLPQGAIRCTVDVVGPYPNIPHSNSTFEFDEKTLKQLRGIAIGTKFAPPCVSLFMAELEEKVLSAFEEKLMIWRRYIDGIFFIWEHEEESLKNISIN